MEAVPAALAAFLVHPDRPAEAIRFAILLGEDTDMIAAMTGALARRPLRRLGAAANVAAAAGVRRTTGGSRRPAL
jgi:hypothetical protein